MTAQQGRRGAHLAATHRIDEPRPVELRRDLHALLNADPDGALLQRLNQTSRMTEKQRLTAAPPGD